MLMIEDWRLLPGTLPHNTEASHVTQLLPRLLADTVVVVGGAAVVSGIIYYKCTA